MLLGRAALPPGLHVVAWVGAASLLFAAGFALRRTAYRWCAFGVLALAGARLVAVELRALSTDQRIATFVLGGALLLIVSFVYARRHDRR